MFYFSFWARHNWMAALLKFLRKSTGFLAPGLSAAGFITFALRYLSRTFHLTSKTRRMEEGPVDHRRVPIPVRLFPGWAESPVWLPGGPVDFGDSQLSEQLKADLAAWETRYYASLTDATADGDKTAPQRKDRAHGERGRTLAAQIAAELGSDFVVKFENGKGKSRTIRSSAPATNPAAARAFTSRYEDANSDAEKLGSAGGQWEAYAPLSGARLGNPTGSSPNNGVTQALAGLNGLSAGTTSSEALAFFDSLPPVGINELTGSWQGAEVPTGHPLDGVLGSFGWQGKRFEGPESAHPLVFSGRDGHLFEVNPWFVPLRTALKLGPVLRRPAAGRVIRPLLRLLRTTQPKARLRMMEYRGVVSATMIYDSLPINDAFRRVDANTLLGAMDMPGPHPPFMFTLVRIS